MAEGLSVLGVVVGVFLLLLALSAYLLGGALLAANATHPMTATLVACSCPLLFLPAFLVLRKPMPASRPNDDEASGTQLPFSVAATPLSLSLAKLAPLAGGTHLLPPGSRYPFFGSRSGWESATVFSVIWFVGQYSFNACVLQPFSFTVVQCITCTQPLWTIFFAWPVLGKAPSILAIVAAVVTVAGAAIVVVEREWQEQAQLVPPEALLEALPEAILRPLPRVPSQALPRAAMLLAASPPRRPSPTASSADGLPLDDFVVSGQPPEAANDALLESVVEKAAKAGSGSASRRGRIGAVVLANDGLFAAPTAGQDTAMGDTRGSGMLTVPEQRQLFQDGGIGDVAAEALSDALPPSADTPQARWREVCQLIFQYVNAVVCPAAFGLMGVLLEVAVKHDAVEPMPILFARFGTLLCVFCFTFGLLGSLIAYLHANTPGIIFLAIHVPEDGKVWGSLFVNGILGAALGDFLYSAAIVRLGALPGALAIILEVPASVFIDKTFLDAKYAVNWIVVLGCTLVCAGVAGGILVDFWKQRTVAARAGAQLGAEARAGVETPTATIEDIRE